MELFLNLCWLSLLLPAYFLWRQRAFSRQSTGNLIASPLVFICVLGCAIVLLFPVISASDDLHAMRPEMEESERAFRHVGHFASASHAVSHASQPVILSSSAIAPKFEQTGMVVNLMQRTPGNFSAPAPAGRAPPAQCPNVFV